MTKRIIFFAGFDANNTLQAHVKNYIESLSLHGDVYFFCDNPLPAQEREKLDGIATICGAERHHRYDFGSWANISQSIGWDIINQYDELIITNDSVYGPIHDLDAVFQTMERRPCDFWGLTSSSEIQFHIQSYFVAFRSTVLRNLNFQKFWNKIEVESDYFNIVEKYEIGLTQMLLSEGFQCESYIENRIQENLTRFPLSLIRDHHFPFIKVKCFTDPYIGSKEDLPQLITYLQTNQPDILHAIAQHHGASFLKDAVEKQKEEPPFFRKIGPIKIRNIRGHRIKIEMANQRRIILPIGRMVAKILSASLSTKTKI